MGITGLIPFLEKASSKVHLNELRGCTVAVDTYCWLHKGAFSCADKLVRGEETDLYLQYCLKYVQMLLSFDIKPILVFDGGHLPAKALTERRRRESRQQSRKRAAELLRLGRTHEAHSHMRRCVDVTHEMALCLIRECRQRNVDCIVAPYEADAQMAWLNKVDVAQYIITEDSDLTLFGARKVIFKLDLTGNGLLVEADKLHLAMGCRVEKYSFDKFRRMCILSGCDYLDSLPGIGLAKACKFVLKTEEEDMWKALKKIPQYLNMKNLEVDDEYIENFLKADATFKHMFIYNPLKRKMERLHDLAEYETEERFCSNAGIPIDDEKQALQLALGNINPFTLKQLDNWHPDRDFGLVQVPAKHIVRAKHKSIWQENFQKRSIDKDLQPEQKKPTGCALFFTKVDFNSKIIEAEIDANLREENAKPEEGEIYAIYNQGASESANESQCKKRRLSNSSDSDNISLLKVTNKTHHNNPFIKTQTGTEQNIPPVCENNSLLSVLSPKKCRNEVFDPASYSKRSKRSLFVPEVKASQVEVKSRFFAANLKVATIEAKAPTSKSIELTAEMDEIERLAQLNQDSQALFYDSPSPQKKKILANVKEAYDEQSLCRADSGIESIDSNTTDGILNREDDTVEETKDEILTLSKIETSIILSDDDFEMPVHSKPSPKIKSKTQIGPRYGLSRPKLGSKSNKIKSKKATTNAVSTEHQTRLSMFGFQKRPTLK